MIIDCGTGWDRSTGITGVCWTGLGEAEGLAGETESVRASARRAPLLPFRGARGFVRGEVFTGARSPL